MIVFVHRKDLRIADLRGFDYIRAQGKPSLHLFILDPNLLEGRMEEHSTRHFLGSVRKLEQEYRQAGQPLHILYGQPAHIMRAVFESHNVTELVYHEDFTPYARSRDEQISCLAAAYNIRVTALTDHVLAVPEDFQTTIPKKDPYKVFTPYYKAWSQYVDNLHSQPSDISISHLAPVPLAAHIAEQFPVPFPLDGYALPANPYDVLDDFLEQHLAVYGEERDRYARDATSGLSLYLNTGAISIRHVYDRLTQYEGHADWLRQLAWREFYVYQSVFDRDFFRHEERYDFSGLTDVHFEAWCTGQTGIPVIDAAMTELNKTGRMPNRLRMVTAMFLTKNLRCPFPLGEAYFRNKLADYDNTLNRGGWLWSASLGYDPAPYFRVMNPVSQSQKFDPHGFYIRTWLPELSSLSDRAIHQPQSHALVDLSTSRANAIDVYRTILKSKRTD